MTRGAITCAIAAFFLPMGSAHAQDVRAFAAIERRMQEIVAAAEAPSIAAAAIQGGRVTWLHADGLADVEAGIRATPDTIYRIGSVSKSITATAIMLAAGSGAVDLSRQVCVPTMMVRRRRCSGIALADALNMSAGMPQAVFYPGIADDRSLQTAETFLSHYAFSVTGVGESYDYSNMGPALAARAVEHTVGESFPSYARRILLTPLGMAATFYAMRAAPPSMRAASYNRRLRRFDHEYETEPSIAAGMVSSLRDLTSFALLHIGSSGAALLSPEQLETLHTPATAGFYAFGWGRISHGARTLLISDGQVNGGQAIIVVEPTRGIGAIVLANVASNRVNELALMILEEIGPGASDTFEQGAAEIETRIARRAPRMPEGAEWSRRGRLYVNGRSLRISLTTLGGQLEVRLNGAPAIQGTNIDAENGYLRWSLPCHADLPACTTDDAEATLSLTRVASGRLAGMITITSLQGQFPYGLQLE